MILRNIIETKAEKRGRGISLLCLLECGHSYRRKGSKRPAARMRCPECEEAAKPVPTPWEGCSIERGIFDPAEPNNTGRLLTQTKEQYEADRSRIRASELKWFLRPQGPQAYYFQRLEDLKEREEGRLLSVSPKVDDRVMGNLFHELLLEGRVGWLTFREGRRELNNPKYLDTLREAGWIVGEVPTGEVYKSSGKYGKAGDPKMRTVISGAGRPVLLPDEEEDLYRWMDGVMRSEHCRRLLEAPRMPEQVIHWDHRVGFACPESGDPITITIPCKAAIDIYQLSRMACLKTTRATNQKWYRGECRKYGYPLQAAFYVDGRASIPDLGECEFLHLVMMKDNPYFSYVWVLSPAWIRLGRTDYRAALERWAICSYRENVLGADPLNAWPDDLAAQSPYLTPDDWMLVADGISPDSFDPGT